MKKKDKVAQMKKFVLLRDECGKPTLHLCGIYQTLDGSQVLCIDIMRPPKPKAGVEPSTEVMTVEAFLEMFGPHAPAENEIKDTHAPSKFVFIILKTTTHIKEFQEHDAFYTDTEGICMDLDLSIIHELEYEVKGVFKEIDKEEE